MSGPSYEVPPLSLVDIMGWSKAVRTHLNLPQEEFPISEFFEWALPELMPGFQLLIGTQAELGNNHGLTIPDKQQIWLRTDVYDGMVDGLGRDRFTACHELGHLLLHKNVKMSFHRSQKDLQRFRCSEWQADSFAGTLLMPIDAMKNCRSLNEVTQRFGVSRDAAATQNRIYARKSWMGILS